MTRNPALNAALDDEKVRETLTQAGFGDAQTQHFGTSRDVLIRIPPREQANAAILSNRCHTVLIENCRRTHPVQFDHGEDIVTKLAPADAIPGLIAGGKIRHCIVVAALHYFELWRRGLLPNLAR
jgi:preprotein translocase subunit SecF